MPTFNINRCVIYKNGIPKNSKPIRQRGYI